MYCEKLDAIHELWVIESYGLVEGLGKAFLGKPTE